MPAERLSNNPKSLKRNAAETVAAGLALGGAAVAGITLRNHRELTHGSVELHPILQKVADLEQRTVGVSEPQTWAAVHRIHHRWTDSSGFPFYAITHAITEAERRGLPVPDKFSHLDPYVDSFDKETVITIGNLADAEVRDRMGDRYQTPDLTDKTPEELAAILNPQEPQYQYPELKKKETAEDLTQDDISRTLLTDPYSPALMDMENGVKGVAKGNIGLYTFAADIFRKIPELRPDDLRIPPHEDGKSTKAAVIGGVVAPALAMLAADRDFTSKGVTKSVLKGVAASGIKVGMEAVGGNITNSLGHMGDPAESELAEALTRTRYKIQLRPDGTITTNTIGKGPLGRMLSWATFDEVGGQDNHHKYPDKIAYTTETGVKAWTEAPWGKVVEKLADSKHFPLIKRGKGFEGERPDVPSAGLQLIHEKRVVQYAREHTVFSA